MNTRIVSAGAAIAAALLLVAGCAQPGADTAVSAGVATLTSSTTGVVTQTSSLSATLPGTTSPPTTSSGVPTPGGVTPGVLMTDVPDTTDLGSPGPSSEIVGPVDVPCQLPPYNLAATVAGSTAVIDVTLNTPGTALADVTATNGSSFPSGYLYQVSRANVLAGAIQSNSLTVSAEEKLSVGFEYVMMVRPDQSGNFEITNGLYGLFRVSSAGVSSICPNYRDPSTPLVAIGSLSYPGLVALIKGDAPGMTTAQQTR
jgi:hypothetical protein